MANLRWLSRTYHQLLVHNSYLYRSCEVCEPDYSWHPASHCEENCWKPGKWNLDRWWLFWQKDNIEPEHHLRWWGNRVVLLGHSQSSVTLRHTVINVVTMTMDQNMVNIKYSNLKVFPDPSYYLYRTWVLTVRGVRGRGELVTEPAWKPILNIQWTIVSCCDSFELETIEIFILWTFCWCEMAVGEEKWYSKLAGTMDA